MEYGNMYQINTKILRIPHLYSAVYTQDFFYKLFTEAEESGKLFLRNHRNKIFILYVWMIWQNCFIKYMTIGEKNAV